MSCSPPAKLIVFDLDETLGSFSELGALWDSLRMIYGVNPTNQHFFHILDIFPSFLRPNILNILRALVDARRNGKCLGIVLYTNNQGPKKWAKLISDYFDYKLNTKVFDLIINAYKVRGRHVERNRTSHDKNFSDLMRCTKLPYNTKVCFIDDQYHTLSSDPNVLYIPVDPYIYRPDAFAVAKQYYRIIKPNIPSHTFIEQLVSYIGKTWDKPGSPTHEITPNNYKLISGLRMFLEHGLRHTRKKRRKSTNLTRKYRRGTRRY